MQILEQGAEQDDASTPTEEHPLQEPIEEHPPKPQAKNQVRFDVDEDPTLPPDLTTFLAGGLAGEPDYDPSPSTSLPLESPCPPPSK